MKDYLSTRNSPGGEGIKRIADNEVTDFPEPDSPTIPTVSPCLM